MAYENSQQKFAELINLNEEQICLGYAALLIATIEYPKLDLEKYLIHLDQLAAEAQTHISTEDSAYRQLILLSHFLFEECGFSGNTENYYDVRNSFLNDVIDRHKGIPITLSVLFIEVARRLGLTVFGVGMPGHFIVKFFDSSQEEVSEVFLDPFNKGRVLSEQDCIQMVENMYQGRIQFDNSFLAVVTKRQILARMLQNLKGIYQRAEDHHKTLEVINHLLLINPGSFTEIRDRGLTYYALKRFSPSRKDLETYITALPHAQDASQIKQTLAQIQQNQARFN